MFPDALQTPRLLLRPLAPDDARTIFDAYAQDPDVSRFMVWAPHKTITETETYVRDRIASPPETSRTYALCDRADGAFKGALEMRQAKPFHVDIGYVLARRWWRQGLMTEAVSAVAEWALAQAENFRVSAFCDVENIGSARVLEKAGFAREGLLRRCLVHPNVSAQPRDCFLYARTR